MSLSRGFSSSLPPTHAAKLSDLLRGSYALFRDVLSSSAPHPPGHHLEFESPWAFPFPLAGISGFSWEKPCALTSSLPWFLRHFQLPRACFSHLTLFRCHGLCYLDLFFPIVPPLPSLISTLSPPQPHFHTQTRGLRQTAIDEWGSHVKGKRAQAWNDLLFVFRPVPCGLCLMVNAW